MPGSADQPGVVNVLCDLKKIGFRNHIIFDIFGKYDQNFIIYDF